MTTIEWHCCKGKGVGHSYDRGIIRNWQDTMGNFAFFWCIPLRLFQSDDGITYEPTNAESSSSSNIQGYDSGKEVK